MRMAERVAPLAARFERLALRERVLVWAALVVIAVAAFQALVFGPLDDRRKRLAEELAEIGSQMDEAARALAQANASDPASAALAEEHALRGHLAQIDAQLASRSAGLIPPRRMAQVIEDVLSRGHGVRLIELRNLPPTALGGTQGPYLHVMEVVLEGSYLDVLEYLSSLEKLPWRFYWRRLELETTSYPTNRVRVELATLSMAPEWVGL